ncbi:hypothetical protein VR5_025 [Escherichia phage vb_EcoM-VR5]|uniref:Uncharacterized protein n=1 Tax=Escherichia phage vb_EcoM-VR5 TaxID=1567026 RepID=A0A0A7HAV7_9CAUD|nr:hypothetical protein AVV69_gp025 [Escherichia phage vb_EcoM-VR5]AIZ01812.1 hypothetical protein VR5_025 [Escherichia phage vb_EcoM-VR5]
MLNRWIKPNKGLDEVIARQVIQKYGLQLWYAEVVVHSFMMHADGSVEFNAEIRSDFEDEPHLKVAFVRGFL